VKSDVTRHSVQVSRARGRSDPHGVRAARPAPPGKALGLGPRFARNGSRSGIARGDFNGDGFGDLVIVYGSSSGLTTAGAPSTALLPAVPASQLWTQSTFGVASPSEAGDRFGYSLAAGDFYGDGRADLAIGVPLENLGSVADAGAVNVIYGSADGLTSKSDQFWTQALTGTGTSAAGDQFGLALY
jgi:hypothetical protein